MKLRLRLNSSVLTTKLKFSNAVLVLSYSSENVRYLRFVLKFKFLKFSVS